MNVSSCVRLCTYVYVRVLMSLHECVYASFVTVPISVASASYYLAVYSSCVAFDRLGDSTRQGQPSLVGQVVKLGKAPPRG